MSVQQERQRDRDRQHRQTEIEIQRQTDRRTDRETEINKQTDKQTDRSKRTSAPNLPPTRNPIHARAPFVGQPSPPNLGSRMKDDVGRRRRLVLHVDAEGGASTMTQQSSKPRCLRPGPDASVTELIGTAMCLVIS